MPAARKKPATSKPKAPSKKTTGKAAAGKTARKAKASNRPARKKTGGRRPADLTTATGYRRFAGVPRPEPKRVAAILELLEDHYDAVCALDHRTPFQLLIATILSAQCTDEMVNKVTPALFARYPDAPALAKAAQADVEALVRPTGFYRNKAKNIIGAARRVVELGGELPREMDTFLTIPGAARKTANVVMGTAFGLTTGVVVDTHVMRLTRRWGFHTLKDAVKVEKVLQAILPREKWVGFSHRTIWHGRTLCKAKAPLCDECPILPYCPEGQALMGHG